MAGRRRRMKQGPRSPQATGAKQRAGLGAGVEPPGDAGTRWRASASWARHRRMLLWLIGTSGAWFLLDFCYYGNTISTPDILALINPHASLLHNTLLQLAIFAVFAVPGYIVAILLLDKTGRRSHPDARLRHDGRHVPHDRAHPRRHHERRAVRAALRDQLLLHPVRAEHDDVHLPGRVVPAGGAHDRPRAFRCRRQDGRVRRLPVPGDARLLAGHQGRRGHRRHRLAGRSRAHRTSCCPRPRAEAWKT